METLSKTICLGVIILALQVLRGLKFARCPRLVLMAARALGVSRKSGYQAARWIREILEKVPFEDPDEGLRQEVLRLRIRTQVLTYERDHPGVRFEERGPHLPSEAKSLCVRILRDFKDQLSDSEISRVLGVPLPSLLRWNSEADGNAQFPKKPERRGIYRRTGPEDVQRVLEAYNALSRDMTLEEFTVGFNKKYPENTLDRRTITRILQANGLRKIETRGGPPPYHGRFKVYFPGAQVSLDGTRSDVIFSSEPHQVYTATMEVGIDIASSAILGAVLGKTETADGVGRVVIQMREECKSILAVLLDNGSANRSGDGKAVFQIESEDARIFSFPYHPTTNGHIEGLFGQFSRIVGRIEIDDTSRETIAASIREVVWRVFIHFHNYSPRERLGGKSPLEYLRQYVPEPEEVEAARKGLQAQREKSRASREPHPRLADPTFRSRVEGILRRNRLPAVLEDALHALLPYDDGVIGRSSDAFFVRSNRKDFDERKRTLPYFVGIVRKKQKESDAELRRAEYLRRETAGRLAEEERHRKLVEKEKHEEEEDLRVRPEKVILWNCDMLLRGRLELARRRWVEGLRRGIEALRKIGRATRGVIEGLVDTIRSWGKYREDLKEDVAKLLFEEAERVAMAPT